MKTSVLQARQSHQVGDPHDLAVVYKLASVAPIKRLFWWSRPTDIARLIVPTVVDPIDRVALRWPWTDMQKEGLEVILPFFAYRHPAPSVAWIVLRVWIETAGFHALPYLKLSHHGELSRLALSILRIARCMSASLAALRFTQGQIPQPNELNQAALTAASPSHCPVVKAHDLKNRPRAKRVTWGDERKSSLHGLTPILYRLRPMVAA